MAGDEDEAQPVVLQRLVVDLWWFAGVRAAQLECSPELRVLLSQTAITTEAVDRLTLGDGRQPGARVSWHTVSGPLAQCVNERFLCQLFGEIEVVRHPCQGGH